MDVKEVHFNHSHKGREVIKGTFFSQHRTIVEIMACALKINICTTITTVLHSCAKFRLVDAPVLHPYRLFFERSQHTRASLSTYLGRTCSSFPLVSYVRADLYDRVSWIFPPFNHQLPTQRFTQIYRRS